MHADAPLPQADAANEQQRLALRLLERLRPLAADAANPQHAHERGLQLFRHRCFERERITRMRAPLPLLGIVLRGAKEFWIGDAMQRFGPGMPFVVPAQLALDIVNIPDPRSGRYESLFVEVDRPPRELAAIATRRPPFRGGPGMGIRLTEERVEALAHAAHALRASAHAATLAGYRLAEVLVLLSDDPAAQPLFRVSLAERVAWLVLAEPTRRWTAQAIGRELGLGASTLRRHLAACGASLREILATTRMGIAHHILTSGEGNVSEATAAAGYASRTHFLRRFRSVYGASPGQCRQHA